MKTIQLFASESVKTQLVGACETFEELETIIRECEPFVSTSRIDPVYWGAEKLLERIQQVKDGGMVNLVTRAHGIREKMIELLGAVTHEITQENWKNFRPENWSQMNLTEQARWMQSESLIPNPLFSRIDK